MLQCCPYPLSWCLWLLIQILWLRSAMTTVRISNCKLYNYKYTLSKMCPYYSTLMCHYWDMSVKSQYTTQYIKGFFPNADTLPCYCNYPFLTICVIQPFPVRTLQYNYISFYYSCFIGDTAVFFGGFLGLIFVVLIFNTVVFVILVWVLVKHLWWPLNKSAKRRDIYHGTIRLLIIIAGLMALYSPLRLFAALTITGSSIAFQVIFAICNTTQSFFIFLLFCVLNGDARRLWKEAFTQKTLNNICPHKTPIPQITANQLPARGGALPSMLTFLNFDLNVAM